MTEPPVFGMDHHRCPHAESMATPPQEPCKGFRLKITPIDIPRMAIPITRIARKNCMREFKEKIELGD